MVISPIPFERPSPIQSCWPKKLTTSSGFKRNDYWLGKFSGLSLSVASDLENYFQEFSSEFYAAVEEINEKMVADKYDRFGFVRPLA